MKTPEEIKIGLACKVSCNRCPYQHIDLCGDRASEDAIAYIEQLEEQIQLMRIQMQGDCGCCKHKAETELCAGCVGKRERPNWEYEGLPEVEA